MGGSIRLGWGREVEAGTAYSSPLGRGLGQVIFCRISDAGLSLSCAKPAADG